MLLALLLGSMASRGAPLQVLYSSTENKKWDSIIRERNNMIEQEQ